MRKKLSKKVTAIVLVLLMLFSPLSNFTNQVAQAGTTDADDPNLRFTTLLANMGATSWPRDCKLDSNGNIFVTEIFSSTYKVKKYSPSGTLLWEVGTDGEAAGQFKSPAGVDVDNAGNVYIADYNTHFVTKLNSSGGYVCSYGGIGKLSSPYDVAVNKSTGNVYVADSGNDRIVVLDSGLQYVSNFSISSDLDNGQSICLDSSGNIYVGDQYSKTIVKYNSSGTKLTSKTSDDLYRISDLYYDGTNIYVSANNQLVKLLASDLSSVYKWSINGLYGCAKDSNGNLLVSVYNKGICVSNVASTNNNLSALSVDGYSLSPVFDKATTSYTVDVASSVKSVTIAATTENSKAVLKNKNIQINSGGTYSYDIGVGDNLIKFVVTSETGVEKEYTVNIKSYLPPDVIVTKATDGGYTYDGGYGRELYVGDAGPGEAALKFELSGLPQNILEASLNLTTDKNYSSKADNTSFVYKIYGSNDDSWVGGTSFPSTHDTTIVASDSDNRNLDYSKSFDVTDFVSDQLKVVTDDNCSFIISSDVSTNYVCFYGASELASSYSSAYIPYLYVRIPAINKTAANFDKYTPADVSFDITVADTLKDISLGGTVIDSSNYTVAGNTVIIKKEYLSTLTTGNNAFTVNMTKSSSQTLTVNVADSTPVNTDFVAPEITSVTGVPTLWQNTDVTLTVSASDLDTGIAPTNAYSFDNGATWQNSNSKIFTSNTTGIIVKVKDKAGNVATYGTPIDITKIDKTAPAVSAVTGNPASWQNTSATLTVEASDSDAGIPSTGAYSFDNGATWQDSNYKTFSTNESGIVVKVKDIVGNVSTYGSTINISNIDKSAPTATITQGTNNWNSFLNTITFGIFSKNTINISMVASDVGGSGVKTIEYYKSDRQLTAPEVQAITGWSSYTSDINVTPVNAEKFVIYAKITDNAGNVTVISSNGMEFDLQAPTIATNYTNNATSMEVTVADSGSGVGTVTYTVNGGSVQTATLTAGKFTIASLAEGKYDVVITANDICGNNRSLTVPIVFSHTVNFKLYNGDTGASLKTEQVEYGNSATAPADPTRTGFVFKNWDKSFSNVTSDITINATWDIGGVTVTPYSGTYDGAAHNAVKVDGTLTGDVITFSTDGVSYSETVPQVTNAGNYGIYVKVARTGCTTWESGSKEAIINKKAGVVSITGNPGKVYNGTAVLDPSITKNSTGVVTINYYNDNAGIIGTLISGAPKDIGTYWVKASLAQDTNYTATTAILKFTIDYANISGFVSISNVILTGDTVTANVTGILPAEGTYNYQWKINGTAIDAATSSSYQVKTSDYGKELTVVLIGNGSYVGSVSSNSVNVSENVNPTATITQGTNNWNSFLNTITFGIFSKNTINIAISGSDVGGSGVKKIEYYKSDRQLTAPEVQAITGWSSYTSDFNVTPVNAEKFVIYAKIMDNAGNVTVISSNGMEFDLQAPTITTNYTNNATSMEVTVADSGSGVGTVTYTVNGGSVQTVALTAGKFTIASLAEGKYDVVITANDACGNNRSLTVPIVFSHTVSFKLYNGDTGTSLKTEQVEYGSAATAPADPTRTGFVFKGWDKSFGNVTSDITINATWDIGGVTVTPYSGTYDGKAHNAVKVDGTLNGDVITFSTDGVGYSETVPQVTNAGNYVIYVKVARTGYTTWESGSNFVAVGTKAVIADMISDIASVEYTGKAFEPIPLVTFENIVLTKGTDYSVTYANNKDIGNATVTITGKGNYSGNVSKSFAIFEKKTTVIITNEQTPAVKVDGLDELYKDKTIYTDTDREIEKVGGTVKIELSVESKINNIEDNKEKIKEVAENKTIGIYLEILLNKNIKMSDDSEGSIENINHLNENLTIVIPISDAIKDKKGIALYRVHNGIASAIPVGAENAIDGEYCVIDDKITLYVRNFSIYAIGYNEDSEVSAISPNTGDNGSSTMLLILLLSSLTGVIAFRRKKKIKISL